MDFLKTFAAHHQLEDETFAALEALLTDRLLNPLRSSIGSTLVDPILDELSAAAPAFAADAPIIRPPSDRYEILGPLGQGGMAEVYSVQDRLLNRTMAMKVIHTDLADSAPGFLDRFRLEARLTADLDHPGIVPIHDLGQLPDGRWYYTMKAVKGRTLGRLLHEIHRGPDGIHTPQVLRRLVTIFLRICETLAYTHARQIIHLDLKPANILIGEQDEVYVMDWGLACSLGGGESSQGQAVVGTPRFMAPEQARGAAELTPRADVFALGVILYHVLSGDSPWAPRSTEEVLRQLRTPVPDIPAPPRSPSPELADLCLTAMHIDPEKRWESAGAMAEKVRAWLDGSRDMRPLVERHAELLRNGSYLAILELARCPGFRPEVGWIAARLRPPLSVSQVHTAIDDLIALGLMERSADGGFALHAAPRLATPVEFTQRDFAYAAIAHHRWLSARASEVFDWAPAKFRQFGAVTSAVSEAAFQELRGEVLAFQERMIGIIEQYRPANGEGNVVAQLNIQLFPLSVSVDEGEE